MIELVTWNVLAPSYVLPSRYGGCDPADLDAARRAERVRATLDALLGECDVVALQEADPDLLGRLRDDGVHVVEGIRRQGKDGVALASRRASLADASRHETADGRRVWCRARVAEVTVVSVHLDPHWPQRHLSGAAQAEEVAEALADVGGPVVLAGDLNATWASRTGQVLVEAGFTAPPSGATAATHGRCRVLDVVAARGCAVELRPTGLPAPGEPLWLPDAQRPSDHVPLRATVRT